MHVRGASEPYQIYQHSWSRKGNSKFEILQNYLAYNKTQSKYF